MSWRSPTNSAEVNRTILTYICLRSWSRTFPQMCRGKCKKTPFPMSCRESQHVVYA